MKKKVVCTQKLADEVLGFLHEYVDVHLVGSREELLVELADSFGLITSGYGIDRELLGYAPELKIVSNLAVGYNNFDWQAMKERHVLGTHTPYVLDNSVADIALGLMLCTSRRLCELHMYVKQGQWSQEDGENLFGVEMSGKTLGIIGMGRIGECVAQRAKFGFGMNVLYYNRNRKEQAEKNLGVIYCEFEKLLSESDFVVLLTPLTEDTKHLIGRAEFQLMKDTAIFINISRGPVVEEAALIEALETKQIWGAGLDVFETEPVETENRLLTFPNVVVLPHIGSATHETRKKMAMCAARNVVDCSLGKTPENIIPELRGLQGGGC